MSNPSIGRRVVPMLVAALLAAGCSSDSEFMAPDAGEPSFSTSTGATLIECPTNVTRSVSGTIGPLGGSLELDGTSITVPVGAVLLPTPITLTLPASNYMEVDITANGAEHFEFEKVVTVTISYARCTRSNLNKTQLTAWYIDSSTKTLLQQMVSTDDKAARTVTFGTDHLSGYSIAE